MYTHKRPGKSERTDRFIVAIPWLTISSPPKLRVFPALSAPAEKLRPIGNIREIHTSRNGDRDRIHCLLAVEVSNVKIEGVRASSIERAEICAYE